MDWKSLGSGILAGGYGRQLFTDLFKNIGGKLTGLYKTIVDATRKAFNAEVNKTDFDFKQRIISDAREMSNVIKLKKWYSEYAKNHRYQGILIQGWLTYFHYDTPLTGPNLLFWDKRPLVLSFGVYLAQTGNLVEYGINLHYLPRSVREAFLADIFDMFKAKYKGQMFSQEARPINEFDWKFLQTFVQKYGLEFAVHSYIPQLRKQTVVFDYQDWGKALALSSAFVGVSDQELMKNYKQHLLNRKRKI